MDEVQSEERMLFVLDAVVHVYTAIFAGVSLDGGFRIDDRQFVRIRGHADFIAGHNRDLGEQRAGRFPAFRAAADVVVDALAVDRHGNFLVGTVTD